MKLLIALTPGILIGCALVETWVSIVTKKSPAPVAAPASLVHPQPHAPRTTPVIAMSDSPASAAAMARLKAGSAKP